MDFAHAVHSLLWTSAGGTQSSVKGSLQGALDTPDAHVVEVQTVAVAGLQGFDEQVVQGDRFEQELDLVGGECGGLLGFSHVGLLGGGLLVNRHPHSRAVRHRSQALFNPG